MVTFPRTGKRQIRYYNRHQYVFGYDHKKKSMITANNSTPKTDIFRLTHPEKTVGQDRNERTLLGVFRFPRRADTILLFPFVFFDSSCLASARYSSAKSASWIAISPLYQLYRRAWWFTPRRWPFQSWHFFCFSFAPVPLRIVCFYIDVRWLYYQFYGALCLPMVHHAK